MERNSFAYQISPGNFSEFRTLLGKRWNDIKAVLDGIGADNFSLWQIEDLVFGYYETETAPHAEGQTEVLFRSVLEEFSSLGSWISSPAGKMRLMYEDFGIVRKNRELIRHRVFVTHLKPGTQEEYKARHDALVKARNGIPDPGPDSNFSIWNGGDYIFGYDEIDTTMELPETPESHESTVAWETRMLEIMDWLTDDVDWLTGLHHDHVKRLACYRHF